VKNRRGSILENDAAKVPELDPLNPAARALLAVPILGAGREIAGAVELESVDQPIEPFWNRVLHELASMVYTCEQQTERAKAIAQRAKEHAEVEELRLTASEVRHRVATNTNNVLFHLDFLRKSAEGKAAELLPRVDQISVELSSIRAALDQLGESGAALPMTIGTEPCDIAPMLHELVWSQQQRAASEGMNVAYVSTIAEGLAVQHDPLWLRYALECLLVNALEAIESYAANAYPARETGHEIRLEAEKVSESQVAIRVIDSGAGFSGETAKRLFIPLFTTKGRAAAEAKPGFGRAQQILVGAAMAMPGLKLSHPEAEARVAECPKLRLLVEEGEGHPVLRVAAAGEQGEVFAEVPVEAAENKAPGRGIGLFSVRRIVAGHGGTISAHSDGPSKGACFEVRLPAPREA
jgi:signal transduction histidine kinase